MYEEGNDEVIDILMLQVLCYQKLQVEPSLASSGVSTTGQSTMTGAFSGLSNMNEGIATSTTGTRTRFRFSAESLPFVETVHPHSESKLLKVRT